MSKKKSAQCQPRPSRIQSGVLNYSDLMPRRGLLSAKTRRRRRKAVELAHARDAIRQECDRDNGVDFDIVHQLLGKGKTLKEAKRLASGFTN